MSERFSSEIQNIHSQIYDSVPSVKNIEKHKAFIEGILSRITKFSTPEKKI